MQTLLNICVDCAKNDPRGYCAGAGPRSLFPHHPKAVSLQSLQPRSVAELIHPFQHSKTPTTFGILSTFVKMRCIILYVTCSYCMIYNEYPMHAGIRYARQSRRGRREGQIRHDRTSNPPEGGGAAPPSLIVGVQEG